MGTPRRSIAIFRNHIVTSFVNSYCVNVINTLPTRYRTDTMTPQTLIEVIDCAHLTAFIHSPFPQRGAMMIVGPPGVLKTTFIRVALSEYPSALSLGDMNINSLMKLRDSLVSGRYRTIAFPEYEKLYQRKADTASNIEGTIKALIEEGFGRASFEEMDAITTTARALVIGAMTYEFYNRKITAWRESGFRRRVLWIGITLANPDRLMEAIRKWELIEIDGIPRRYPTKEIPFNVTDKESRIIENMLKGQWEVTPYVLLKKILAVLKWKYPGEPKKPMQIMDELGACLDNKMGVIEL
jgi:hypothetical protein